MHDVAKRERECEDDRKKKEYRSEKKALLEFMGPENWTILSEERHGRLLVIPHAVNFFSLFFIFLFFFLRALARAH